MSQPGLQPLLHDLVTCLAAPAVALSGPDGQLREIGAHGVFAADMRVLSRAEVQVGGREPEWISTVQLDAARAEFISVIRSTRDPNPDPVVWLRRRRSACVSGCAEMLTVSNVSESVVSFELTLAIAADLADIETVKSGRNSSSAVPQSISHGVRFASAQVGVDVTAPAAGIEIVDSAVTFSWQLTVPARSAVVACWSLTVVDSGAAVLPIVAAPSFSAPQVTAADRRLAPFVKASVADLQALLLSSARTPNDEFVGAGSPWYLTLFGRDSIWAARMLLPLGTDLARGTLRTLAAFQGSLIDIDTAEEPGKIPHEIRRPRTTLSQAFLPPVYYGTVDATPLWVCLLADAWRWGMASADVAELLPAAEAALEWMRDYGDSDGDGFLEYIDLSGRGLTNQGWKDSGDSVRFADGRIADGPVALAEVQAYAYQAAMDGAALLEAFGRPGAERWRHYAADLAASFRAKFWVGDELGRYPALALDGAKRPVDAPASNMGHLLGTGILNAAEALLVAERLVHATMASGFGLRTMSSTAGGYSPLSYHCGSVWPHDTAIAIAGLQREGLSAYAGRLAEGLLAASAAFGGRVPELFGGFDAVEMPVPAPYPASCRPQAWSAASAVVVLTSCLGLAADVPQGVITLSPTSTVGGLSVAGLRVADGQLSVRTHADGSVVELSGPAGIRAEIS